MGKLRPLQASDALPLPENLHPRNASSAFDRLDTSRFTRFTLSVFFATGARARRMIVLTIVRVLIALSTPILLKLVLEQIAAINPALSIPAGLLALGIALGVLGMTGAVVQQHFFYNALGGFATIVNGMNRRVVRHALQLRHSSRSSMNTGDLVNHLSSDTDAIAETSFFVPEFLNGAFETLLVLIVLFVYLGWAALAAVGTMLLLSPLTVMVARRYRKLDHQIMELRDERVTLMSQILQGIRVVKFHAWEPSVHAEVADVRRHEINTRVRIVATDAMSTMLFISTSTVVAFTGFTTFVLLGGTLTAPLVFACIALFALLEEPFGMISHLLANLQHARVATTRLHAFFTAPVRKTDERVLSAPNAALGIEVTDVSLRYANSPALALDNVQLGIRQGAAVAIIGPVGAGKSSLLRTMAGLHQVTSGTVEYTNLASEHRARTAYVPQEAFIMNASVSQNILFGNDDAVRLQHQIIHDCALEEDLRLMTAGLETEIGERGVNLSGGQKQRVSLARAACHEPGVVFLDDPLSAVDVSTEDVLIERLIFGRWSNITRVVVTHRLTHLDRFDHIVVMEAGRVIAQGTYSEVEHLVAHAISHSEDHSIAQSAMRSEIVDGAHTTHAHSPDASDEISRITEDEDRGTGAVRLDVYWHYLRAMVGTHPVYAPLIFIGLVVTACLVTALPMLQTSWLGYWTDINSGTAVSALQGIKAFWNVLVGWAGVSISDPLVAVAIYGVLGTFVLSGWLGERFLWLYRSAAAGKTIHNNALEGVLGAPLRFFDSTPMGRVLNRFARDQEGVDDHLSWNFEQSFKSLTQTVGALVLILAVLPIVIVVLVPVLLVYYRLQKDYRTAAREAKRLESIGRSPRYAHFKELVTGLDVIHGFGKERFFMDSFYSILAEYQKLYWCSITLNRWFSVRIPIVSGFVAVATSIGIIVLAHQGTITTGIAGIVLTYALSFWWNLNWAIRSFSEVESRMTSVERLRTYGSLPPEPRTTTQPALPASTPWPTNGALEVSGLHVRYAAHLPLVLKDISFSVPARAKVGIVGRTGSGKSTLFQALFRFVEPESGEIRIDGVDITSVPLQRLRRSIAIIPQDPTLFIGTVRNNLDRFSECTDEEVWTALRRVQLADVVLALPGKLDGEVLEGGLNFSQGQRQLLCMARAILTDARLIVLDEATASVDNETDALIQKTIREEFSDVTVLIIAHRLDTVADADMIIEIASGKIARVNSKTR